MRRPLSALTPAPLALALLQVFCAGHSGAQTGGADPVAAPLKPSADLTPPPRGESAKRLPIVLNAQRVTGHPDRDLEAVGDVEFRRGPVLLRADRLTYDVPEDLARATGNVRIRREGVIYSGPELQLRVQRFEGFFREPEFEFLRLNSRGEAERVDFLDAQRAVAHRALYTSCPRDGSGDPPWVLKADRVRMDFETNEGIAEGGVLRFLGVPILAWPKLSFPLTDARKSGWLPPNFNLDSRSGLDVSAPYYWNIAPNRDATFTPRLMTRRGPALTSEFRYLEPAHEGRLELDWIPHDRVLGATRHAWSTEHRGTLGGTAARPLLRYEATVERVSDELWWRDFPDAGRVLTSRLLPLKLDVQSEFSLAGAGGTAYARALRWQVLQYGDSVAAPYERSPQVGAVFGADGPVKWQVQTEFNRFTLPGGRIASDTRSEGDRFHVLARVGRTWREPGWWFTPQVSMNAASYRTERAMSDGRTSASRVIPTFSVDSGLELERDTTAFGRAMRQTLEPRLHYVNTPYRAQDSLPNFDAAGRDFNSNNLFADSDFAGVDRVSDSHQIAAGLTTRLIDAASGAEALRLGIVQRYLLRTQRVTADGQPLTQRFSDVLLVGSTSVIPSWFFDTSVQYSAEQSRARRALLAARFSPGEFRTVSATYRFTRDASEQLELGWQWPLVLSAPRGAASAGVGTGGAAGCGGNWYTVGRVNYSSREKRITDSILGLEYDAGCWIGRIVAERLSTGRSEATTRLIVQLELVGLSRLGGNPLKTLRDNIPGYRLLRDEVRGSSEASFYD